MAFSPVRDLLAVDSSFCVLFYILNLRTATATQTTQVVVHSGGLLIQALCGLYNCRFITLPSRPLYDANLQFSRHSGLHRNEYSQFTAATHRHLITNATDAGSFCFSLSKGMQFSILSFLFVFVCLFVCFCNTSKAFVLSGTHPKAIALNACKFLQPARKYLSTYSFCNL